ncbi:MAG TPA: hypothetical protein VKU83_12405, partial [Puia sp.]|nr:hypothetical protein [Puia sp.]
MGTLIRLSRKAYGLCIIAMGIQQLAYGKVSGDFLPEVFATYRGYPLIAYSWGALFTLWGIALFFERKGYEVSLISATVFMLLLVGIYIPYCLLAGPFGLLDWSGPIEESAFVGASLIVASSYPPYTGKSAFIRSLSRLIPLGGLFFAIMLICYGTDHFVYTSFVSNMVPAWIPSHFFWTYFAGVALISAGIAIALRIGVRVAASLLALMIFLWFLIVHIPTAIRDPAGNGGL